MKQLPHKRAEIDPLYQDTPWEIILDDHGKIIGEVFLLYSNQGILKRSEKKNDRTIRK